MRSRTEEILKSIREVYENRGNDMKKNVVDFGDVDPYAEATELLGWCGAMRSGSKTAPKEDHVVWNANVFANRMKIWFGDISITEKAEELQKLADKLGVKIYVLREMDGRFDNEVNPLLDQAVATFEPKEV